MGAVGSGFVGGLKELEQGGVRIGGRAHGFIGEDEFAEGRVEAGLGRRDGVLSISGWLGIGVAVKEGVNESWFGRAGLWWGGRSGPESATRDFVRVGIARDAVGQARHAGMGWRDAAGETRAGEIHCSPEEVNGANLAAKSCTEDGEDTRGLQENSREALRVFGIVRMVRLVFFKGDAVGNFAGDGPDVNGSLEGIEGGDDFAIKGGDGRGSERDGALGAIAGLKKQSVIDEVEVDLERANARRHG